MARHINHSRDVSRSIFSRVVCISLHIIRVVVHMDGGHAILDVWRASEGRYCARFVCYSVGVGDRDVRGVEVCPVFSWIFPEVVNPQRPYGALVAHHFGAFFNHHLEICSPNIVNIPWKEHVLPQVSQGRLFPEAEMLASLLSFSLDLREDEIHVKCF